MAEPKTRRTKASVAAFLTAVEDEGRRADCKALAKLMREVTGNRAAMWGTSIVGFGSYRQRYASGREVEWPVVGFSPRKRDLTLYIMAGFSRYDALLEKLGKHKHGKSCLYIKSLQNVHLPTLKQLIRQSVKHVERSHV